MKILLNHKRRFYAYTKHTSKNSYETNFYYTNVAKNLRIAMFFQTQFLEFIRLLAY